MKVYAITDIGSTRSLNEDCFYLPKEGESFCAVADGMGGHNAGEVASAMAIECFAKHMRPVERANAVSLDMAVRRANEAVYASAKQHSEQRGMGTTLTALCANSDFVYIAHVGDSRAYLIRNKEITQITTDHTLVEEMVRRGMITEKEARVHPNRNIITRAIGSEPRVDIDIIDEPVQPGDIYLLCSDGLCGYVSDETLLNVTLNAETFTEKLRSLVSHALKAGGYDNITAMYVVISEANA